MSTKKSSNPTTIDEYLAQVPPVQRTALQKLRKQIHAIVPKAQECITYQMPTFRLGRLLVGFAAYAQHCSFFPMSGSTVKDFEKDLQGYSTSKGTIQFTPDNPLPAALLRKIIKARLAENARKDARKKTLK